MARKTVTEELKIEVKGPERTSNTYICKIIADALKEVGITHMEVINQFGDDIASLPTPELYQAARLRNPILGIAGVAIFPEGPVVEEVTVHENTDLSFEDDISDEFDPTLEFEPGE